MFVVISIISIIRICDGSTIGNIGVGGDECVVWCIFNDIIVWGRENHVYERR